MPTVSSILSRIEPRPEPFAFLGGRSRVLIYGAGNAGRRIAGFLAERGVPPEGFLDANAKPGMRAAGLPVYHPSDAAVPASARSSVCVALAIFNALVEIPPILAQLKGHGYDRVVTFPELHRHFPEELGDWFWLCDTARYAGAEPLLEEAQGLLADAESRELFAKILEFRITADYGLLPRPNTADQYFDPSVPGLSRPERFVDCGAFDGDTLKQLHARHGRIGAIAAFEPDLDNFRKICAIEGLSGFAETTALFPCGVWSSACQLSFRADGQGSSQVTSGGTHTIQCVSLDEALPAFAPTYVKMDIEGAEYEALLGARRTITEHRPALAISAYHRPQDLWTLPILVRRLGPGYRLYLRSHCHSGFDLVLYAIPA